MHLCVQRLPLVQRAHASMCLQRLPLVQRYMHRCVQRLPLVQRAHASMCQQRRYVCKDCHLCKRPIHWSVCRDCHLCKRPMHQCTLDLCVPVSCDTQTTAFQSCSNYKCNMFVLNHTILAHQVHAEYRIVTIHLYLSNTQICLWSEHNTDNIIICKYIHTYYQNKVSFWMSLWGTNTHPNQPRTMATYRVTWYGGTDNEISFTVNETAVQYSISILFCLFVEN